MGWTKREFINQAFEEIGLAGYVYDLEPEQMQSALRRLDSMMASWNARGIRIGYPLPGSPSSSNESDATNVPDSANEAVYLNLGVRIAPSFGKQLSAETKQNAKRAYDALLIQISAPPQMQMPYGVPAGAGNKLNITQNRAFLIGPSSPLQAGEDSEIEFT